MSWWRRAFQRNRMEALLDRELRFHLDQHVDDLIARGVDPDQARRIARLELGGAEQVKEACRDARGTRWLEDLGQDVRYALRTLRRQPGFAAVALITLALGCGATTVMFTVIDGVLLKPLPFPDPDRLAVLHEETAQAGDPVFGHVWAFAYPNFLDCRRESRSLALAAWRYSGGVVSGEDGAEYADGFEISSDLFAVLGVTPALGRGFGPDDDRIGAPPVLMLGYEFWQRRFAGGADVIGSSLRLDDKPYIVIGVAPARLRLEDQPADVFLPIGADASPSMQRRDRHPGITVFARRRAGATLAQAQAELDVIGRELAGQYPASNGGRRFVAELMRLEVGDVRATLWLLLGAVALVLLVACANVASLLLARAVSRERELAMRAALGAGRGRLVRQCLTESAVLAVGGGALGIALAEAAVRPFVALWPGNLPRAAEIQLDWRVLLFALAVSGASGLLFGLAPALRAPAKNLEQTLRAGARTLVGSSRRLHGAFVAAEIALATVLLVSAGMLGRTLLTLSSLDPGIDVHDVLVSRMAISAGAMTSPGRIRTAWDDVLARADGTPGVETAALVDTVPMREGSNQVGFWPTSAVPPIDRMPVALATSVTPSYLRVMGLRLLKGRFFDDHDRLGGERVVVIDDVLAAQAFGGADPVGRQLWMPAGTSPFSTDGTSPEAARIVGVVAHVRHWGLASDDQASVRAQFYYPFAQVADGLLPRWSELMSVAVRTTGSPRGLVEPLRRQLRGAAGDQALYDVHTLAELASASLARQRFLLVLFGVFAGAALLLACIGVYGVLAYLTGQRVPEIGVRLALGASGRGIMWMVFGQSLPMIGVGIGAGAAAAVVAGRVMARLVDGMRPTDASSFAIVLPVLVAAACVASLLPARRASRVDPMAALRDS